MPKIKRSFAPSQSQHSKHHYFLNATQLTLNTTSLKAVRFLLLLSFYFLLTTSSWKRQCFKFWKAFSLPICNRNQGMVTWGYTTNGQCAPFTGHLVIKCWWPTHVENMNHKKPAILRRSIRRWKCIWIRRGNMPFLTRHRDHRLYTYPEINTGT